jgi:hypothetical protein
MARNTLNGLLYRLLALRQTDRLSIIYQVAFQWTTTTKDFIFSFEGGAF